MNRSPFILHLMFLAALLALPSRSPAFELPEEALKLIAGTTADPCSICAGQNLKKALALIDERLRPGAVFTGDGACSMVKSGPGQEIMLSCQPPESLVRELQEDEMPPRVVFAFHTAGNRLVGISENDYTGKGLSDLFLSLKPGAVLHGRLRLIPYRYGDGATFNYYKHTNTLQFHCVILELRPAVP